MAVEHEYYSKPGISASALKQYLSKDPAYFKMYYDGKIKHEPSDKMNFGTAVHAAILEPEVFAASYVQGPDVAKTTSEWKRFVKENEDKEILTAEEWRQVQNAKEAVFANSQIRTLLEHQATKFEQDHYWKDKITDLPCKALADTVNHELGVIMDIKTTGSPIYDASGYDFRRDIYTFNYDIQDYHYREGFGVPVFYFIPVETKAPYRVGLVKISAEGYRRAMRRYRDAMRKLEKHFALDDWPGIESFYEGGANYLEADVPRWMK